MKSNLIRECTLAILSILLATRIFCQEQYRTGVIEIESGPVQGFYQETIFLHILYGTFKGIPYAKPPLGELRFRPPQPNDRWTEVFDATEEGPTCPQYDTLFMKNTYMGDEDCLTLNVYTPTTDFNSTTKYPVMVWIYGGAFVEGYKNQSLYGPDFFIEGGVVLVTFNYRLGALGFLHLGIDGANGNAGMMDQVLALKWVQKNIVKFGGDPTNVTIFGESAGSSSVVLHELSPQSEGLYHNSIGQSGAPLILLSQSASAALISAHALARRLGFDSLNKQQLLESFRKAKAYDIVMNTVDLFVITSVLTRPFQPSVQDPTVGDPREIFLGECPITLMMEGKLRKGPKMLGYNTNELYGFAEAVKGLVPLLEAILPYDVMIPILQTIAQIVSSIVMVADVELTQRFYAAHNDLHPVYYNKLMYIGFPRHMITSLRVERTTHADDLGLLFTSAQFGFTNSTDLNLPLNVFRRKFVQLYVHFAKQGNPTPASNNPIEVIWEPSGATGRQLIIDTVSKMSNRASGLFDFLVQSIYYFLLPLCSGCYKISYATPYTDLFSLDGPVISLLNTSSNPPNITSFLGTATFLPVAGVNSLLRSLF